jgi:hypothetical protein
VDSTGTGVCLGGFVWVIAWCSTAPDQTHPKQKESYSRRHRADVGEIDHLLISVRVPCGCLGRSTFTSAPEERLNAA